jgi:hypothetical protein
MLEKLRIEQTKSRSRHSNDNALAESKNASIVRKHMGYEHIPKKHAQANGTFYQEHWNRLGEAGQAHTSLDKAESGQG